MGLGPVVSVKKTLDASAFCTISSSQLCGNTLGMFQHDCAPLHKARFRKTRMSECGVEELDGPTLY